MSRVAELLLAAGRNQGDLARQRGEIWGNAVANIAQIPAQIQHQRRLDAQTALEQAREARLRGQEERAQQLEQEAHADIAAKRYIASKAWENGEFDQPAAVNAAIEAKRPDLIAEIHEQARKLKPPPVFHPAGSVGVDPLTGQPVAGATIPEKPPVIAPGSEAEYVTMQRKALKDAGTPEQPSDLLKWSKEFATAKRAEPQSEWSMFASSYAKQLGKKEWDDLNPGQQQNAFSAFARAKADPAAERQARTLQAQIDAENRRESFSEAQAGRKELTDKVETPYQTARASSNTLRDVVAAAQAGNKVAGSLQSLETTMAAIRAQGLNRINTAEIGVTANAGNLWDRLQGWFGKAEAGQPVPENVQKDMLQFADILDKAAYQKYITGHQAITTRYGLKDEKPLPGPTPSPTTSAAPDLTGLTPGHSRRFTTGPFAGQTWTLGAGGQPVKIK